MRLAYLSRADFGVKMAFPYLGTCHLGWNMNCMCAEDAEV